MSWKFAGMAWDLDLPHSEVFVLLALLDHADHLGEKIFPSVELIAWKTGYRIRNVQIALASLRAKGILVVTGKSTRGQPTEYKANLRAAQQKPEFIRGAKFAPKFKRVGVHRAAPKAPSTGAKSGKVRVQNPASTGAKSGTPYKEEPLLEPLEESPLPCTRKPKKKKTVTMKLTKEEMMARAHPFYEIFESAYKQTYGLTSGAVTAGFVQFQALKKRIGDALTEDDWRKAVSNYFATARDHHTMAELCVKYAAFRLRPGNQYRGKGSPGERDSRIVASAQRNAKDIREGH